MFGEEELIKLHKPRIAQVSYLVVFSFLVILSRLWYLQVYKGDTLYHYSIQNKLRQEVVPASRGTIYSRDGVVLVDNTPRFDAVITPQFLLNRDKTLAKMAKILDMSVAQIEKKMKKNAYQAKYRPIIIKKNISFREVARIETENFLLPGVSVHPFISRNYHKDKAGAHLLGYISEISQTQLPKLQKRDGVDYRIGDFVGQFGLEEQFDLALRGQNGTEYVEVDALGRRRKYINTDNLFKGIDEVKPVPGNNIKLTIDSRLQDKAFSALEGKVGSLVAIDVQTGEILAMVSRPSFNPSQFTRGIAHDEWEKLVRDEYNPLRDRVIQEHYSPGSTFKPFTAIAALETDLIDTETKYRCHGALKFGRRVYHSWKLYGNHHVTVEDALKESCNIFFYKIGTQIDIDDIARYAKLFGFGEKTGIHLPREIPGLIPTREWKEKIKGEEWQPGETLSCSIGQSYILATVLQLANSYAAIANEGKLFQPYLVKEILDQENMTIQEFSPKVVREIELKKSTWDSVKKGLYKVVNDPSGTAWWRRGEGLQMAGKTGTSQVIRSSREELYKKCDERDYEYRHHGVFVAFAPYDNPKVAVASLVEHGCGGSSSAAPVVASVIDEYMKHYMPDEKKSYAKMERAQYQQWLRERKKAQSIQQAQEE